MSNEESAQDVAQGASSTQGDRYPMMIEENKLEVLELYKNNPRLWADFRKIIDFMDFFQQHPRAYERLLELLNGISFVAKNASEDWDRRQRIGFMVAVGFVDKAVEMYIQLREEMGNTFMTRIPIPHSSAEMACFHKLNLKFVNGAFLTARFGLCLARTGALQKILNDLRHMQDAPQKDLEEGHLYEYSVEILHNCCFHPEVLPTVRDLGTVDCLKPFLAKSNTLVRVLALMTLGRLVNDSERSLLRLHSDVLRFLCDKMEIALAADFDAEPDWMLDEVLYALCACAKQDSNRKMLSTDSFLHMLAMVLQKREKEEKALALAIIRELGKSPDSLQDLARVRRLRKALEDVQCSIDPTMSQDAATILSILPAEGEDHPHLTALLADRMNLLTIMGMGEVDYVVSQLKELCAEGGGKNGTDDVTRLNVLQALAELAEKSDTAKEIVDKGGLDVLSRCLQRQNTEAEVKRQTLLVQQQLFCHKDCCDRLKMMTIPGLVQTLRTLRKSPGSGISHLAADILKTNTIPLE